VSWQQRALDRHYNRDRGWVDGTAEFHAVVAGAIPRGGRILEIGAGPSNVSSDFFAGLGELTGLDVDPDVMTNRSLHEARVFDGGGFPFDDAMFDACVSNYVLEHVADPATHFSEVRRVLKPQGAYVLRTPNRYHYVAFVSWIMPHWIHAMTANRLRGLPEGAHDPYPTVYAANSKRAIGRFAAGAGLSVDTLRLIEKEPSYGMASPMLFYPLLAYERVVNATELFSGLRANMIVVLRKQAGPSTR
jgi:SAM-dependent methyltransferase